jgi:hypothetical protein
VLYSGSGLIPGKEVVSFWRVDAWKSFEGSSRLLSNEKLYFYLKNQMYYSIKPQM